MTCAIVLAGSALRATHDGTGACDALDSARATAPTRAVGGAAAGRSSGNIAAGGRNRQAGGGAAPRDATPSAGGDALPVLEPTSEQPTIIALGRSRAVRRGRATFDLGVPEGDGDAAADTGQRRTDGNAAADAAGAGDRSGSSGPERQAATPTGVALGDEPERVDLDVVLNPLLRDDRTPLVTADGTGTYVTATAWSHRGVVSVEVCVDRDGTEIGHPGTYAGSVTVIDPRVTQTDVPFVVTMAYPNAFMIALLNLLAVAAAAAYTWLLRARRSEERVDPSAFVLWLTTRTGVLAVMSGAVAAYVAFAATYLSDATWGASLSQYSAVVGAVFTAFVTAATTILVSAGDDDIVPRKRTTRPGAPSTDPTGAVHDGGDARVEPGVPTNGAAPERRDTADGARPSDDVRSSDEAARVVW